MYKDKTFLAIIPARGGSKRLPQKNILILNGKPLIDWTIEAALNSRYIDEISVSSDNEDVLNIANKHGISLINRPAYLASDTASSIDVVTHAISNTEKKYDYVILLQPTSPLRNFSHIDESIDLLLKKKADAVISVAEVEHSPLWCNTLPSNNSMIDFLNKDISHVRSQDLEQYYRINGAIYICDINVLMERNTFFVEDKIYAYKMDRISSVDIDEEIDFQLAQLFFANIK